MSTLYVTLAFLKLGGEFTYEEIAEYGFIVTWIFYDGALISLLVEPCHQTHAELQKVKVFISHLLCFWPDRNFRSELSHFYNEFVNNVIVFSPLGVFTLTRKFIVTVIGAIITFITIIQQFHLKDTLPVQIY
ncbi:uncharacterized protein LOC123663741 [Melitaea cinxia]|uniref:uncharacterized protein LOC123663741 n=1 Tax=Melitaea cinxia TaxID=113334 RepID=UPI001E27155F|nr:uncharacterized protein LOC123663741 [Melitaea cinxia]